MVFKSESLKVRCYSLVGSERRASVRRRLFKGRQRAASWKLLRKSRQFPLACSGIDTKAPTSTDVKDTIPAETSILVGDIGGTNARLTVWKINNNTYHKLFEKWFPTKDYKSGGFYAVLRDLFKFEEVRSNYPTAACFAIAGPVKDSTAIMTNTDWTISSEAIEAEFKLKVTLMNDFEALGYGIPLLDKSDLVVLNDVPSKPKAPIAVLGPGTGLGEAQLMWDEARNTYRVWPSEGSHSDFAPRNAKQRGLQKWIIDGYGYCEIEHVACGTGLERIYTFLKSEGAISVTEEPILKAPEISKAALSGEDEVAAEALDMMLSIIGAEAGHMGLRCLAHGGVFIAGGITPKVIERIKTGIVLDSFLHEESHRFRSLLESFRLYAVMNEEVGLIGCRHQATQLLYSS